jgi:hypothetical protein
MVERFGGLGGLGGNGIGSGVVEEVLSDSSACLSSSLDGKSNVSPDPRWKGLSNELSIESDESEPEGSDIHVVLMESKMESM